ncbi:aldehyde oxidase GLOX-like [Aristolochia californica]|uniref:aldehyde oxidase GLOX-like n=1 Tax=Aristolochia californica TaxID=171875 RepID=UPI0035DF765A
MLSAHQASAGGGRWELLQRSIGISAMHMQLLYNDRVVIFDRTDFGRSNISLPDGKCRRDPYESAVKMDCSAHSVEYDVPSNTFRPLMILTDTWCSSGTVATDGRLIQTGGFNDGDRTARRFNPCVGCDWEEIPEALAVRRWYATNQILPDGRAIVVGGRRQFNYEFYPKTGSNGVFLLPFLQQTNEKSENNLYPFLHLNVDGNLFIFANNRAILLDYGRNAVVKTFPAMPGGPRNYPSTGSSVLLPLVHDYEAEVLVCGGAPPGSFEKAASGQFVEALSTCGRIKITEPSPKWFVETMPVARAMGDMVLLPDGSVLIINGATQGAAGWENGRAPATNPVVYWPGKAVNSRFELQNPSTIPRLYHSSAVLLRDGRVLVGGSNPHSGYEFYGKEFPTELSLEAFSPTYLSSPRRNFRPAITFPPSRTKLGYGHSLSLRFRIPGGQGTNGVIVTLVAPSFATHSFSMNQRMLVLGRGMALPVSPLTYQIVVSAPKSSTLAPPGYYLLFIVHGGVPSEGIWIQIQ